MAEVNPETGEVIEPEPGDDSEDAETEEEVPLEEPEGQAAAPVEAAAPPGPPPDETDPRIIASQKKWENYEKALRSIWGEYESNLMECPLCFTSHKGLIDLQDAGSYPEEILAAITAYARGADQVEYRQDPQTRTCDQCGGAGKTQTGSHVEQHKLRICPACKGYGYVPPPGGSGNGVVTPIVQEVAPGDEPGPLVQEDVDLFGHPRLLPSGAENPNYGKMPQFVDPTLP